MKEKRDPIFQNGELYDVDDFRLALCELNRLGYDLSAEHADGNLHRLNLTCLKTNNRFVLESIGNNDWPESSSVLDPELKRGNRQA